MTDTQKAAALNLPSRSKFELSGLTTNFNTFGTIYKQTTAAHRTCLNFAVKESCLCLNEKAPPFNRCTARICDAGSGQPSHCHPDLSPTHQYRLGRGRYRLLGERSTGQSLLFTSSQSRRWRELPDPGLELSLLGWTHDRGD